MRQGRVERANASRDRRDAPYQAVVGFADAVRATRMPRMIARECSATGLDVFRRGTENSGVLTPQASADGGQCALRDGAGNCGIANVPAQPVERLPVLLVVDPDQVLHRASREYCV